MNIALIGAGAGLLAFTLAVITFFAGVSGSLFLLDAGLIKVTLFMGLVGSFFLAMGVMFDD